ncbi:MAG TPA: hypothetical protein VKV26_23520 [Dehalococcoidia bacterium]|nr:hypothetical protein [Dehalococcoidia bacterium]
MDDDWLHFSAQASLNKRLALGFVGRCSPEMHKIGRSQRCD